MDDSRGTTSFRWLMRIFLWSSIAAFGFLTAPETGGYTLTNLRFVTGLVALAVLFLWLALAWKAVRPGN